MLPSADTAFLRAARRQRKCFFAHRSAAIFSLRRADIFARFTTRHIHHDFQDLQHRQLVIAQVVCCLFPPAWAVEMISARCRYLYILSGHIFTFSFKPGHAVPCQTFSIRLIGLLRRLSQNAISPSAPSYFRFFDYVIELAKLPVRQMSPNKLPAPARRSHLITHHAFNNTDARWPIDCFER